MQYAAIPKQLWDQVQDFLMRQPIFQVEGLINSLRTSGIQIIDMPDSPPSGEPIEALAPETEAAAE